MLDYRKSVELKINKLRQENMREFRESSIKSNRKMIRSVNNNNNNKEKANQSGESYNENENNWGKGSDVYERLYNIAKEKKQNLTF